MVLTLVIFFAIICPGLPAGGGINQVIRIVRVGIGMFDGKGQKRLTLAMLGRPRVVRNGIDLTRRIKYRKAVALLGYLAAHAGIWLQRERLADLLWPELDLASARTNLRQVLANLGSLLNDDSAEVLQKVGDSVALIPHPEVQIDIALLSDAVLDRVAADALENRAWRERQVEPWATALGEEFLDGLDLSDALEFSEWLRAKRVQFRSRGTLLLEYLCQAQRADGRLPEAIASARLLADLSPLDENRHGLLMSLLAESGDEAGALEVFAALEHRLKADMGVGPGGRLIALRGDILGRIQRRKEQSSLGGRQAPEVRLAAVLFCVSDLLRDDEAGHYFAEWASALVKARGGIVVSVLGRGLLAVFGLDGKAEGITWRALLAAREISESARNGQSAPPSIGICTGRVLLRSTEGGLHIGGDIPDIARFIGWSAAPGEIRACEAAAQQVRDRFRFELLGEQTFLGLEGCHKVYRWLGEANAAEAAYAPLSGRREELARLAACWDEAAAGQARIAVLRAPAGLGKTRLASELMERVAELGGQVRRIRCSLEHQHEPLAAVLAALAGALKYGVGERPSKSAVFADLVVLLNAEAEQAPILLVVDDLHWSDLATRELIAHLARSLTRQRLLMVLTVRPEVDLDYPGGMAQTIDLAPLDDSASLSLVEAHDPGGALTAEERADIVATCGGIPLFIERLVKSRLEGGHHQLSITELLQSELDRLGGHKTVLHAAAVLGNRFERRHLMALLPDADVPVALTRALGRRLVDSVSAQTCAFRHALIRDTAYQSLPASRRRQLHERAAHLLMQEKTVAPEEVARHFTAAGCHGQAVDWWIKAGEADMACEFAADAMASFQQALDLLSAAGPAADKSLQRAVRMRLGYAAQVAEGFGSPLTWQLFRDMLAEIEAAPESDPSQLFSALCGCYMGSSSFGKDEGLIIARRLQALARTDAERLMAAFALGNTLFWRGDFEEALAWQRQGIALAAQVPFQDRIRYGVDDPAVTCRAINCWTLWFLGQDDAACAMADEAVTVARKGRAAHAQCFALVFAASLQRCRDDVAKTAALAGEALALAKQYAFPLWEGVASLYLLWAQARAGAMSDPSPLFGAAALLQQAIPGRLTTSRWIVASALIEHGDWQEAERLLDTALREVEFQEEQYCLADLLHLKGLCLDRQGLAPQGDEHRRRAIALAQRQGASGLLAAWGR